MTDRGQDGDKGRVGFIGGRARVDKGQGDEGTGTVVAGHGAQGKEAIPRAQCNNRRDTQERTGMGVTDRGHYCSVVSCGVV